MASKMGWLQHDNRRPKPPVVEPLASSTAAPAPRDAVVLFGGTSLDAWQSLEKGPARWKVGEGFMEVAPGTGAIASKGEFGDVQLHIEWASPNPPGGKGQDRGNSGIFLMGLYELQVLDSYRADTYADGQAGAIYGQYPPLANASRPPGEWQTYDIAFRRPRFDKDGKLLQPARVTLIHNGILIQNNEELWGSTGWLESSPYEAHADRGRIQLQDHGHPVRFRNIWVRDLPERPGARAGGSSRIQDHFTFGRGAGSIHRPLCDGAREGCAAGHDHSGRRTPHSQAPVSTHAPPDAARLSDGLHPASHRCPLHLPAG